MVHKFISKANYLMFSFITQMLLQKAKVMSYNKKVLRRIFYELRTYEQQQSISLWHYCQRWRA